MAEPEEKVRVLKLDTQSAVKSVADLKSEVATYRKEMEQAAIGSEQYKTAQQNLLDAQNALQAAQRGCIDTVGKLDNSYNGLVVQMKKLKDAQKQIDVSTEAGKKAYADYAKKINGINNQLKGLDAQNGVFVRNVGDYANQFGSAMSTMGVGANGLTNGLKGVKGVLDVLKSHPIIAIIAIVIALIKKLVDAVKKNEESYNRLKVALAPIQGIMNLIGTAIDKVATKFVELTEKVMDFAAKITGKFSGLLRKLGLDGLANGIDKVIDKVQQFTTAATDIETKEANLAKQTRNILVQNAKLERDIAKQRDISSDKQNYNANQRLEAIKKAGEMEKQIAANNLKMAEDEYALLKLKAAQTPNDKEANDQLAQAEAKRYQVQQQYYATLRSINKETSKLTKEIETEIKALETLDKGIDAKPKDDNLKNRLDAIDKEYEEYEKKYKEFHENQYLSDEEYEDRKQKLAIKKAIETERAKSQYANKEYEKELRGLSSNDNAVIAELELQANIRRIYGKQTIEDERQLQEDIFNVKVAGFQRYINYYQEQSQNTTLSPEEREKFLEQYNSMLDELQKMWDEYYAHQAELQVQEQVELIEGLDRTMAVFESAIAEIIASGDGISSQWSAVFKGMDDMVLNLTKNIKTGEKGWKTYGDMAAQALGVASSITSALADEQDATTKEGFEKQKRLQIASAVMSMLSGIVYAMTNSIRDLGIPAGPIVGAAMSAMIAGLGGAQIAQIKKQTLDGGGGSTAGSGSASAAINMSAISQAFPQTYDTNVQNASVEGILGDTRVYVTETDITDTQERVRVSETENTF